MSTRLSTYDPHWEKKWNAQYDRLPELWRMAVSEVHEQGALSPQTKAEYVSAIRSMRRARQRKFETVADVASRMFNILAGRAALVGEKLPPPPAPESFGSLREIREFFTEQATNIKQARVRRRAEAMVARTLPVMPKGEGAYFSGAENTDLITQAFFLPDVDNGFAMIVTTETVGDNRYIAIGGRSSPSRFRAHLPQIATLLAQRLFKGEEPQNMYFFVYHPVGYGPRGHEQYWAYDLKPDLLGNFIMAGRHQMHMLPYAVARPSFADGLPLEETSILPLDKYFEYAPGVEMEVSTQERATARMKAGKPFWLMPN